MPYELCPSPSPQLDPWNDPSKVRVWETNITSTAQKWGVDMKLPHVSPHPYTHLAHEGYQYAKDHGKGNEYNHRVFTAFFQEEHNIGEIEILAKIAGGIGLDEAEFKKALETRKYREIHQKALKHAYEEAQMTSVPTIFIGNKVIQGAASRETFEKVINQSMIQEKE